jgi:ankyrin repeat protein
MSSTFTAPAQDLRQVMVGLLLCLSLPLCAQEQQPASGDATAQSEQQARRPIDSNRLAVASKTGQVEEVRALLMAGGNPATAFKVGVLYGQAEVVALAIELGAPLTGPEDPGVQAVETALSFSNKATQGILRAKPGNGYDEIIGLLLDHGVPADSLGTAGLPLLVTASLAGNAKGVSLLLDHDAKPDREAEGGGTPLACAAMNGHGEVVELLLKAGASVNLPRGEQQTALQLAACAGSHEAWALLAGKTAEDFSWDKGRHGKDHLRAVKALIGANANVNAAAKNGVTPLMAASRAGDVVIATELLDAGAGIHYADDKGRTALMAAVSSGVVPVVQILLERGADPKAVALDGSTALGIAKRGKEPEMERVVKKALERKEMTEPALPAPPK